MPPVCLSSSPPASVSYGSLCKLAALHCLAFLGGLYLGAYARVQGGEAWNTTIHAGGHYQPYEPRPQILEPVPVPK